MFKQITTKNDCYYKHKIFQYNIGRRAWNMARNGHGSASKFIEYKIN